MSGSIALSPRWRWLLWSFTRREILNRYAGSVSGLAWSLLHPLLQLAVFSFVFKEIFRVPVPEGYSGAGYLAFVAVALWPWVMFSEGLVRAMGSVAANAGLIRKVAFPHELLVYASVLGCIAIQACGFVAVLVALRFFGEPIHFRTLPSAFVLLIPYALLATGIGAILAALQALLRDVEHVVQIVIMIVFYATPILYPLQMLPAALRPYMAASPPAWFSERMREIVLRGDGAFVIGDLYMTIACVGVFLIGRWFFLRLSPHFEDFL